MISDKNLVLFTLGTPGHLINSLSIIGDLDKEGKDYHYFFLDLCKATSSVTGIEKFQFPESKFSVVRIENREKKLLKTLEPILDLNFSKIFIYLEYTIENAFLAVHFKKKGALICLVNDGNRPYYVINRWAIKSRITETFKFYKTAFKNKLPTLPNYIYTLKYGRLKYIDEYWVPFALKEGKTQLKGDIKLYSLLNEHSIQLIKDTLLNISEVKKAPFPFNDIIFYMNNVLYRTEAYQAEIKALKEVKRKNGMPLIIKMHPATPISQVEAFNEVGDYVFKNAIPAEIYMMHISNSIFLSGWSSSLLFNNKQNCSYYWFYEYFIAEGLAIRDLVDFSLPDTHIEHPLNLNEIRLK